MAQPFDIEKMFSQTGRLIKEDNSYINQADYLLAQRRSNIQQISRDGNLYRSFFQGTLPSATTWYFVLDIPVGITLFGVVRSISIEAGSLRASFFNGGTFATIDATYPAYNFDNRNSAGSAKAQLKRVSGQSGLIQQDPNVLITAPTTGPQQRPSTQTESGAMVIHDSENKPFFSLQNDTGSSEQVILNLFWQEIPTPEV